MKGDRRGRCALPSIFLMSLTLVSACATHRAVPDQEDAPPDLAKAKSRFAQHGVTGSFLLLTPSILSDPASPPDALVVASEDDPQKQALPASTFKILNTLIGLKTGMVKPDEIFAWDGKPRPTKDWEKDLNFIDAFRVSCVPCYQDLARRVGIKRMQELVREIGYGNADIGEKVDLFWLEGPLAISVQEQAEFVRRVYLDDLPFDQEHLKFVKSAMKIEENSSYALFAKTGWAMRTEPNIGWYVGWIQTASGTRFFATRIFVPGSQPQLMASLRKQLTLELLQDLKVIP